MSKAAAVDKALIVNIPVSKFFMGFLRITIH